MTDLYNPFTGEVSKAVSPMYGAKDAFANQPTRKVASLLPTGKHVSHANDLYVTRHGKRKNVGRFGDTKLQRFGKADEPKASGGRYAAGMGFGPAHGLVAGKKGKKAGAFGSHYAHTAGAALPGYAAMLHGLRRGSMKETGAGYGLAVGGGLAGSHRAVTVNQRKGRYKPEVAKSDLSMQPGMINPGVQTSAWSHGTPNQNFAAANGRRGRKIA